jgi:hypothetical protein
LLKTFFEKFVAEFKKYKATKSPESLDDDEIGGLTISDPPTQAEVYALHDACEEPADDVRALSRLVNALQGRSSRWEWWKGVL